MRRIAQAFFHPKQIVLTILGNLEKFKIGREDSGAEISRKCNLFNYIYHLRQIEAGTGGGDSRHPPQTTPGELQEHWYLVLDGTKRMQHKGIFP